MRSKNAAVQDLIVQRTIPTDTIQCPGCMQSVAVERDPRTHIHALVEHACPKARTPVAFIPGKYAVVALIWNPAGDGTILSVSRKDNHADFGLPGGKADPLPAAPTTYEDPLTALRREVEEETAVVIKRARYVYWRRDYTRADDPRPTIPALCFLVDEYEGTPRQVEAGRVEWVQPSVVASTTASFGGYNRGLFDALFVPYTVEYNPDEECTPENLLRWIEECDGFEVCMSDEPLASVALGLEREGKIVLGGPRGPGAAWRRAELPR